MEILTARKAVSLDSGRFSRRNRSCENSGLPPPRVERTVLSRAQGFCEACGAPARSQGSPTGKPSLRLLPLAVSIEGSAPAHDRLFAACGDCFRRLRREDANRRERERCLDRIRKLESALAEGKVLMVTAAILLDEEGKVLLAQRKPRGRHPASWEFPGGKVEPGEGLEDCLIREIREELGLRIQSPAAYLRVDIPSGNRYFRLFSFLAIRPPGEIRLL